MNKKDIIKQMQAASQSPEAVAAAQLQQRAQQAEVAKTEAEAQNKGADSQLKTAKVGETLANTRQILEGEPDDGGGQAKMADAQTKAQTAQHTAGLKEREMDQKMSLAEREHNLKRETEAAKIDLQQQDMEQKRQDARVQAVRDAATAAAKPTPTTSKG